MPLPALAAVLPALGRAATTVGQVAGRAGTVAAEAGSTAGRAGTAASRVGSAASRVGSTASRMGSTAERTSRGMTVARTGSHAVSGGVRKVGGAVQDAADRQPQGRANFHPAGTQPNYAYGPPPQSQQFMGGPSVRRQDTGISGLDQAEATTGVPMRREGFQTPAPLGENTLGSQAEMMAWKSKPQFIGTYINFDKKSGGAAFQRPQG